MEKTKNIKFIIVSRHSERIDLTRLSNQQKNPLYDPELTKNGKQIAVKMGQKIKQFLQSNKISINEKNYILISSPYTRCLQTSRAMQLGMSLDNKTTPIKVENRICEFISDWISPEMPDKYLVLYQPVNDLFYRNKFEEFEKDKLNSLDDLSIKGLVTSHEDEDKVDSRCKLALEENISRFSNYSVLHFLSHASPCASLVNLLLNENQFSYMNFNYCTSVVIKLEEGKASFITKLT